MAILEKEIWVTLNSKNVTHYEKLGYEIAKVSKKGTMRTPRGTAILVKVEDLTKGSNVKLTRICDDCGKTLSNRSFHSKSRISDGKDRCHQCGTVYTGMIRKDNPLYVKSLEYYAITNDKKYLLSEFSPKNNKDPKNISHGSGEFYFWICPEFKHEYEMNVCDRKKFNCPYCTGRKVLKGFNDLWTTHPHIAKLLKHEQRGYEISSGSGKKEEFKCEHCGFEKGIIVGDMVKYSNFPCPKCSDGIRYPEKFVFECLTQLNIEFEYQKTFDWSKNVPHNNPKLSGNKKYDFYIPTLKCIIETHGGQHFKEGGGIFKPLEEEQDNDKFKEELAKVNGIETYMVLDCSESEMEHIKNSIILSKLSTMYSLEHIDWLKCHKVACHSLVKTACDLWNKGNKTIEIGEIIKLEKSAVIRYLKRGKILVWCDYDAMEEMKLSWFNGGKREIVQLSLDGEFIRHWESINQVQRVLGINSQNILKVCKGQRNNAGGFKWMYKEDYEGLLE